MKRRWETLWLRPRRRALRLALWAALALAPALLCVSCVRLVTEPANFFGVPRAAAEQKYEPTPERPYPLQTSPPYTVALDPGHGGMDTGGHGYIKEVTVCERTVDALYALLEADPSYTPCRARPNGVDISSADRAQAATDNEASLFLSIHANMDDSAQSHGFECFPKPPGRAYFEESMRFAQCLTAAMRTAGHRLRGENGIRFVYYYGKRKKNVESSDLTVRTEKSFAVVELPHCPAVLIEQCFLTNASDAEHWASDAGCSRAARVYYEAVCAYFGTQPQAHRG